MRSKAIPAAALALTVVATGCGGGTKDSPEDGAAPAARPSLGLSERLHTDGFSAEVPAAWHRRSAAVGGGRAYFLASSGPISSLGIARPGAIGLTVSTARATAAVTATREPKQVIARVVGRPPGARNVRTTKPATPFRIGSVRGATVTYTYLYRGRRLVQTDAVAVRRGIVAFIEADASPADAAIAAKALATAARSWRWAPPPGPPSPAKSHDTPS